MAAPGAGTVYQAGRQGCLLVVATGRGCIVLTGRQRHDLLHRITTNDIRVLKPGEGAPTLLLTGKGRLLERLTVLCREDELWLITSTGGRERTRETVKKFVVFEDVQVEDRSARMTLALLAGPRAGAVLAAATGTAPPELFRHHAATLGQVRALLVAEPGFDAPGFLLVLTPEDEVAAVEALRQAAASAAATELLAVPADHAELEVLRIEAGLPALGSELSEDWNPMEARQEDALSFSKGCYVGQEVIARLRTYDKVRRGLVRLRVQGTAATGDRVSGAAGEGVITSAALLPGSGDSVAPAESVALAMMDVAPAPGATGVTVLTAAGERPGTITGLPPTARDLRVEAPRTKGLGKRRFGP